MFGTSATGRSTRARASARSPTATPGLLPLIGWNYDAAVTWYIDRSSYISLAGFQKDLKNLSESVTTTVQILGLDFRRTRPENVDDDRIRGVEMGGQYTLTELPAPFDGLGLQGNTSFVGDEGNPYTSSAFTRRAGCRCVSPTTTARLTILPNRATAASRSTSPPVASRTRAATSRSHPT